VVAPVVERDRDMVAARAARHTERRMILVRRARVVVEPHRRGPRGAPVGRARVQDVEAAPLDLVGVDEVSTAGVAQITRSNLDVPSSAFTGALQVAPPSLDETM